MIGYLRGRVIDTSRTGHVLVDVNGVGYDVTVGKSSEAQVGSEVVYFIYTSVRPDAIVPVSYTHLTLPTKRIV